MLLPCVCSYCTVQALVQRYDVDGDGEISISEFKKLLMSRNSANKRDWLTVDKLSSSSKNDDTYNGGNDDNLGGRGSDKNDYDYDYNDSADYNENEEDCGNSEFDDEPSSTSGSFFPTEERKRDDSADTEYEGKMFLKKMRAILMKRAQDMRASNGVPRGAFSLGQHSSELFDQISRNLLQKEFEPYARQSNVRTKNSIDRRNGNSQKKNVDVDYESFCMVMKRFVFPGTQPLGDGAARMLFNACCGSGDKKMAANPYVLADMIFLASGQRINQFGFSQPVIAASHTGNLTSQFNLAVSHLTTVNC